jgi:hypothetical protein
MFGRSRTTPVTGTPVATARGGISGGAVVTGVVVAFGAMFLLSALTGGILTAAGVTPEDVTDSTGAIEASIGAGIVVVIAQLLAYFWGGYTAGRMARGAGVANGLLVPLLALGVAVAVGAVVTSLGATANLNLPFSTNRLPLEEEYLIDWGLGVGIAVLAAMFVGGAFGGGLGARWHTRLEQRRLEEVEGDRRAAVTTAGHGNGDGAVRRQPATPNPPRSTTESTTTRR